ncbi:SAM-dependent methyltransferase [Stutzerimonas nosocomialis]|nr:SAM-dependent methyltransferase [Stutzerimonas nosocomialis]
MNQPCPAGSIPRCIARGIHVTKAFVDHFKDVSQDYASNRPTYPAELFDWLASQCQARRRAWDCATGSGQAAVDLARHFEEVIATDASASQIAQARPHPRVRYATAPADASGLDSASVDLVTVAQALHWFDIGPFHAEVRRVLKPGGVVALWCYGVMAVDDADVDALVQHFYRHEVGAYWPPERRHVETGYRELPFPFEPIAAPDFAMQVDWSLPQLLGYLRSWSATARRANERGSDPVEPLARKLAPLWTGTCRVSWPLSLYVGRV